MTKKGSQTLWYPRYPGDYQRKTSHLSLTEHGVYAVLLDHYYATGQPLPANAMQLQRVCRAFEAHEVDAMHVVLRAFFVETAEGYRNARADEELSKRSEISGKRSDAASSRHQKVDAKAPANAPAIAHTATATVNTAQDTEPRTALKVAALHEAVEAILSSAQLRENTNGLDGPTVKGWLERGARLREDILPTIDRIAKHRAAAGKKLPGNLTYYTGAIFDDMERRKGNGPPVKPEPKRKTMEEALAELGIPSAVGRRGQDAAG